MNLHLNKTSYGYELLLNGSRVARIEELEDEPWEGYKWAGKPINPEGGEWTWCSTLDGAVAHCIKSKALRMAAGLLDETGGDEPPCEDIEECFDECEDCTRVPNPEEEIDE
jgi:hypothetical protein